MEITFFQSADPFQYLPMLAITAENVTIYCQRHGFGYESFVGIKRGCWPWQACFNRIIQYHELLDRGFRGWAVYIDADAWINDLDFDLSAYLADKGGRAVILAEAGRSGEVWDINNGVMLLNLGCSEGRRLIKLWRDEFLAISDAELETERDWLAGSTDQDLLQRILRRDTTLGSAVLIETQDFINSRRARFIRQHLRSETGDLRRRIENIAAEVQAVMSADPLRRSPAIFDDRALYGLRHSNSHELRLVEAPRAPLDLKAADAAVAYWGSVRPTEMRPHLRELGELLANADAQAVAHTIASFGRSPAALGEMGGPRQHDRVAREPVFARKRALRTQDALTSLAEASGALSIENPDHGLWGFNVQTPAAELLGRIGMALGADVSPPDAFGSYLGIEVENGRVLHLRMIEALHSALRVRQVQSLLGLDQVIEFKGGIGLRAFYAHRLGGSEYTVLDEPVMGAIQTYLLTASGIANQTRLLPTDQPPSQADLLFNEETLVEMPKEAALDVIRTARSIGVRAILSVNHEAQLAHHVQRPTVRELVLEAGGFRLAQRALHAIRPGFVEELFVANHRP